MEARAPLAFALLATAGALAWWWSGARDPHGDAAAARTPAPAGDARGSALELAGGDAPARAAAEVPVDAAEPPAAADRPPSEGAPAAALVRGVILDALDRPCPELDLWRVRGDAARMLSSLDEVAGRTRSAADGTFALAEVAPGRWLVGPRPYAGHAAWGSPVDVPAGVPTVDVVLRLPPELAVGGLVLGPDGTPVAHAVVRAASAGAGRVATSGADGAFRLGPFVAGRVHLAVERAPDGWVGAAPVETDAGDDDVVLRVARGATLTVHVRDALGAPLAGNVVSSRVDAPEGLLARTESRIGDDGRVRLTGLPPGLYQVMARARDGRIGCLEPFHVDAGAAAEVTIPVAPGGRLRVHLPPEPRAPVARVLRGRLIVDFLRPDGAPFAESEPLPPGPVRVELLLPDGAVLAREATVVAGEVVGVAFD